MTAPLLMQYQDLPFNGDTHVANDFLDLKARYGLNVAVETGSCMYTTTSWLGQNFDKVYTVEINEEYAKHGRHKIAEMPNVKATIGDSVDYLNYMARSLSPYDKAIFFLDAHWGQHCPLLQEIEALEKIVTIMPPVIAIHDFYTGDETLGYDEYNGQRFDYEWIKPSVEKLAAALKCSYLHSYNRPNHETPNAMRGVIYLTPKF